MRPLITVTPMRLTFVCKAGETPAEQKILVSATWPKLAYRLTLSSAPWLRATPEHGTTPRHGSAMADDIVHVAIDTVGLKPGHYTASITVSSWQVLEPVRVEVELTLNE